jgi:hypothetical protein
LGAVEAPGIEADRGYPYWAIGEGCLVGETKMSYEHNSHRDGIIADFSRLCTEKYNKGQVEHGGNLWEKKGLIDMAIDEAIDQVVYLLTLKKQIEESGVVLGSKEDEA